MRQYFDDNSAVSLYLQTYK